MAAIIALAFGLAAFLVTRAFTVERRAPVSAWRDATFGTARASHAEARSSGPALRTRSRLESIARLLPNLEQLQAPADRMVAAAGVSTKLTGAGLIGICAVMGTAGLVVGLIYMSPNGLTSRDLTMIPVMGLLLGIAPVVSMSSRGKRRREAIDRALPDILDLLVVSVEAGLALEGALQRVSQRAEGPLTQEIQRTLNEVALGRRRHDALASLAARCQVPPLATLVNAMNQAERTGMQMGPVLRAQSEQIRTRRRQNAEEKAMKAPLKMLFPLAFFIFPAMFLVILGPAVIGFMG